MINKQIIIDSDKVDSVKHWASIEHFAYSPIPIIGPLPEHLVKWINKHAKGNWCQLPRGLWPESGLYFEKNSDAELYKRSPVIIKNEILPTKYNHIIDINSKWYKVSIHYKNFDYSNPTNSKILSTPLVKWLNKDINGKWYQQYLITDIKLYLELEEDKVLYSLTSL